MNNWCVGTEDVPKRVERIGVKVLIEKIIQCNIIWFTLLVLCYVTL